MVICTISDTPRSFLFKLSAYIFDFIRQLLALFQQISCFERLFHYLQNSFYATQREQRNRRPSLKSPTGVIPKAKNFWNGVRRRLLTTILLKFQGVTIVTWKQLIRARKAQQSLFPPSPTADDASFTAIQASLASCRQLAPLADKLQVNLEIGGWLSRKQQQVRWGGFL